MASFTGKQIENTYQSILNIGSVANPNGTLSAVLSTITDGAGNDSSLTIGAANAGIRVTGPSSLLNNTTVLGTLSSSGQITAAGNAYPSTLGTNNQVLKTNGSGTISFGYITASNMDPSLTGASTVYTGNITSITVDGIGRITAVATGSTVGLGYSQTWQNMTASRAADVAYVNSTGRPIFVSVGLFATGGPNSTMYAYVDSVPVAYSGGDSTNGGANSSLHFIVPNGSTYYLTGSKYFTGSTFWSELR